jgi:predicted XRE-type DNA-binding protein
MTRDTEVTAGSGNVFADLGLPESEVLLAKAHLVHRLAEIAEEHGWSNAETAEALDLDAGAVADLLDGDLEKFSLERLFGFLSALGQKTEIVVHPARPSDRPAASAVTTR